MIEIVDDLPKKHTKREIILCDLEEFMKSCGSICKPDTSMFHSISYAQASYSHEINKLKLPISTSKVKGVLYLIKNQEKTKGGKHDYINT